MLFVKSTISVHRIPSRVRDDREPPLCGTGRSGYNFDLGETAKGIFLQMRLDCPNQLDPVQQIRPCAQMAWPLFAPMSWPSTFCPLSVMARARSAQEADGTYLLSLPLRFMRD